MHKPPIVISTLDAERLERLLEKLPAGDVPGRAALEEELTRAEIVAPEQMPANVVTMNSTVTFRVDGADEEFTLTLVYPHDHGGRNDRISILAPVGSALLGLSDGDEIDLPRPGGGSMRVRIVAIDYQPERAGDFRR